jgi:hypothetical protein
LKWFHRHGPWEAISAYCDNTLTFFFFHGDFCFVTYVNYRCRSCGIIKQKTLKGKFSIDQLRGEDTEVSRVLRDLEK